MQEKYTLEGLLLISKNAIESLIRDARERQQQTRDFSMQNS